MVLIGWLDLCVKDQTLPPPEYLLKDPDFTPEIKQQPWFSKYLTLSPSRQTSSNSNTFHYSNNTNHKNVVPEINQHIERENEYFAVSTKKRQYLARDCVDMNYEFSPPNQHFNSSKNGSDSSGTHNRFVRDPPYNDNDDLGKRAILHQQSITIERFTDDDKINDLIRFDEDLNRLQGSLFRFVTT
jgi:hypothetical protein